jgi:NADPH-dependent 2,4-dienoyl-CoA reductase/sulfur reductase-like enzyme
VLVAHGIDAIHVSGGVYESAAMIIPPAAIPQGCYIGNAAAIKEAIHGEIPVMVVGRIKDPIMAEKIIKEGKADFVVMGRPLLADPELPNKAKEGRLSEIRKCIACNQGCIDRLFADLDIGCLVNAMAGHELEYTFLKPAKAKKVVIVGAGPAGLETARVAAIRGHDVTLYEEKGELGGQLPIASVPPGKDEISDFTTFLIDAVKRLDVKIHTKTKADISMILKDAPDAVIIATGSKPIMPDIPGAKLCKVVSAHDVLEGKVDTGKNVVIIGGGAAGCETADYLAGDGKSVTVVEMLDDIATDTGMLVRALLLNRLREQDVSIMTKSKVVEIVSGGVIIDKDGRTEKIDDVDTIVFAVGAKSENALANALKQKGILMTMIGDCVEPGKIMDAVEEGFSVAYHL